MADRFYWEWDYHPSGRSPRGILIFDRLKGSGDSYVLTPVALVRDKDPELADMIVENLNERLGGRSFG